jgi:hypothetical protein
MLANWFFKKKKNDDNISFFDLILFVVFDNYIICEKIILDAGEILLREYKLSKRYTLKLLKEFSYFKNTKKNNYWEKLKKLKLEKDKEYIPNVLIKSVFQGNECQILINRAEIQVLTSIKIKGSFESLAFEIGGQKILRIKPIQLKIQEKDSDGFIEILNMNHLNISNIIYHDTCLTGVNCNMQYKIAGYNNSDNQVYNSERIHYPIKQVSFSEKINIKDKENFKYKCIFSLSAICIILVVEPDKLKSIELNIDNEMHKIDAKYLKIENIMTTKFYNYNIPFENCYYIPLYNVFSSQNEIMNINFEFEKKDDYDIQILYINENILTTASGMCGLCLN